ncbi:MAG TPA: hypothetical protein PLD27_04105 [bacterium]|mgnify:CR=1 FL=1|nr:hypothetical protein [bacterium]HOL48171.1 hypothetical protein [bacterium]HPQ18003.1 hypothetical protein [bacterium]
MNEIKKIIENINKKINLAILLFVILILADLILLSKLISTMNATPQIFFPAIKPIKEPIPEVKDEFGQQEITLILPDKYKILTEVNFFKPFVEIKTASIEPTKKEKKKQQRIATAGEEEQEVIKREPALEEISGFTLEGIIAGGKGEGAAIIKEIETENVYIAKTGDYLFGTNIKVKKITRGKVVLSKPRYKDTELTLKKEDRLFQYWLEAEPSEFEKKK